MVLFDRYTPKNDVYLTELLNQPPSHLYIPPPIWQQPPVSATSPLATNAQPPEDAPGPVVHMESNVPRPQSETPLVSHVPRMGQDDR